MKPSRHVQRELDIDAWVIDATVRENLHVVDARGTTDKEGYLIDALGEREERRSSTAIRAAARRSVARTPAHRVRQRGRVLSCRIGHGRPRARSKIIFATASFRIVVATSAFGEGIDLPDVRDVFLYHLNFDFTQFNQQAGRAGRDGAERGSICSSARPTRQSTSFIIERDAPDACRRCARSIAA